MKHLIAVLSLLFLLAPQAVAQTTLRPELGSYGSNSVKSPNIDALAARGLQFNRAYCQLALCNPSRASLLTGKRPESIGVFDLATFVRKHDENVVTLPQHFMNHGYRLLCFGKIFHTTNGNKEDLASWSERPWKPRGGACHHGRAAAAAEAKPEAEAGHGSARRRAAVGRARRGRRRPGRWQDRTGRDPGDARE